MREYDTFIDSEGSEHCFLHPAGRQEIYYSQTPISLDSGEYECYCLVHKSTTPHYGIGLLFILDGKIVGTLYGDKLHDYVEERTKLSIAHLKGDKIKDTKSEAEGIGDTLLRFLDANQRIQTATNGRMYNEAEKERHAAKQVLMEEGEVWKQLKTLLRNERHRQQALWAKRLAKLLTALDGEEE